MGLKLIWVDAFTTTKFGGNPCAVVLGAERLKEAQMLTFAKEMNLSETAFVVNSQSADFGARYFTPAEEIPLAGHPTIATIHALIESGFIDLSKKRHISLELKAGIVQIELRQADSGTQIVMSQMKPMFLKPHDPAEVAALFALQASDILATPQTVSTGTPQLMIAVKNHGALRRAQMNVTKYKDYKSRSDFFSPHLFCLEGATKAGQTFARHFGVPPDTLEDAFTGSATGGMAAYLWRSNLIPEPVFIAEQGHWMGRPGSASVEVVGPREDIQTVKVAGQAVTILRGEVEI